MFRYFLVRVLLGLMGVTVLAFAVLAQAQKIYVPPANQGEIKSCSTDFQGT